MKNVRSWVECWVGWVEHLEFSTLTVTITTANLAPQTLLTLDSTRLQIPSPKPLDIEGAFDTKHTINIFN